MAKILVIEDEENMAKFVQLELQHENYEVKVATDGRTGLDSALNEDWDLIYCSGSNDCNHFIHENHLSYIIFGYL